MSTLPANEPTLETYRHGDMVISFLGLPAIKLVSVLFQPQYRGTNKPPMHESSGATYQPGWFTRLAESTVRRHFTLERDWEISLSGLKFNPDLNGTITVPARANNVKDSDESGELVVFDGASVPMPWLISFLSIGILRPLGVMLTASIVHDFAFKFGYLLVTPNGANIANKVPITRDMADRLFRAIIITVNKLPIIGWAAWLAVRLGWFGFVPYNGKRFGGRVPLWELIFTVLVFALPLTYIFMPDDGNATDRAFKVFAFLGGFYLLLYGATTARLVIHRSRRRYL